MNFSLQFLWAHNSIPSLITLFLKIIRYYCAANCNILFPSTTFQGVPALIATYAFALNHKFWQTQNKVHRVYIYIHTQGVLQYKGKSKIGIADC